MVGLILTRRQRHGHRRVPGKLGAGEHRLAQPGLKMHRRIGGVVRLGEQVDHAIGRGSEGRRAVLRPDRAVERPPCTIDQGVAEVVGVADRRREVEVVGKAGGRVEAVGAQAAPGG